MKTTKIIEIILRVTIIFNLIFLPTNVFAQQNIDLLLKDLKSPNIEKSKIAVEKFGNLGVSSEKNKRVIINAIIESYEKLNNDKRMGVSHSYAEALSKMGNFSFPALRRMLKSYKGKTILTAGAYINKMDVSVLPQVIESLYNEREEEEIRKLFYILLIQKGAIAVPYIVKATGKKELKISLELIVAIGQPAAPNLIKSLKNGNKYQRVLSAVSLGIIRPVIPEVRNELEKQLTIEKDKEVKSIINESMILIDAKL